jgi:hypothetical protein
MAQTYSGVWKAVITNTYANALDLGTVTDNTGVTSTDTIANGTGANNAQVLWHDQRTLTTATGDDLDLAGGLTNAFGTVTFTKIKGLFIEVTTATTGYRLQVGADASNPVSTLFGDATDLLVVQAGGQLLLTAPVDGYTVTGATGDILQIYNPSGGSVTYKIMIIGEGSIA